MQFFEKGCGALRHMRLTRSGASARLLLGAGVLAMLLTGCSADKQFETEIIGHPAPAVPTDTGWPKTASQPPDPAYTPPPAPPVNAAPAYQPRPFTPAQQQTPGVSVPPKPGAASVTPVTRVAPARPGSPVPPPAPAVMAGDMAVFTYQVGAYAHIENAKHLMSTLESRGFSTRMDEGTMSGRTYFRILAVKTGRRAELEGELLACGVTEPRLMDERPVSGAPRPQTPAKPAPAASGTARTRTATTARTPTKTGKSATTKATPAVSSPVAAPPVVEPAPPLPDGYVPPPQKGGN